VTKKGWEKEKTKDETELEKADRESARDDTKDGDEVNKDTKDSDPSQDKDNEKEASKEEEGKGGEDGAKDDDENVMSTVKEKNQEKVRINFFAKNQIFIIFLLCRTTLTGQ
jgi:hypothetical protein